MTLVFDTIMPNSQLQVQLQEETLEEDQAWPVNMRVPGSRLPYISDLPGCLAAEPDHGEGAVLFGAAFSHFVQSLVMLMFDNKRSLIKLKMQLLILLFPAELSIYRLSVFFLSEPNQTSDGWWKC